MITLAAAGLIICALATSAQPAAAKPDPSALLSQLAARGLVGTTTSSVNARIPEPPTGTEVDEFLQTAKENGEVLLRGTSWEESFGDNALRIEIREFSSGQKQVSFWARPRRAAGCLLFGINEYDRLGNLLQGGVRRCIPDPKPFRGPDYPDTLYPSGAEGGVPVDAFFRALSAPQVGATGAVQNQITPYEVVELDVWAAAVEQVHVPAGDFRALKLVMRVNVRSVMRNLPGFLAAIIEPFLPKNILYYQAEPPYRFLKFEGVMDQDAPQLEVQLVRYYTAGARSDASTHAGASSR
jgi:hypothetical protein